LKGGEPLLRKDLCELIAHAKSLGFEVCLLTNGYFMDGKIYDNLVKNEVFRSISIDGSEKNKRHLEGEGLIQSSPFIN